MTDTDYSTKGAYVSGGAEFTRDTNYITTRITRDGRDGYPVEPGRYRLIAARACPWANRTIIVRRLLGLENAISMGLCGPTHDERSWTFDLDPGGVDPVLGYERLQQAYFARFPDYPRGITVPAVVDIPTKAVVTNDYAADHPRLLHRVDRPTTATVLLTCIPNGCGTRSTRSASASTPRSTTASTGAVSPAPRRRTRRRTTDCSPPWTGSATGWPISATWWATPSPKPTSGCSPRWPASIPSITVTSSATGRS